MLEICSNISILLWSFDKMRIMSLKTFGEMVNYIIQKYGKGIISYAVHKYIGND